MKRILRLLFGGKRAKGRNRQLRMLARISSDPIFSFSMSCQQECLTLIVILHNIGISLAVLRPVVNLSDVLISILV